MSENAEYLASVSQRIAGAVLRFCAANVGETFHADDLRIFVDRVVGAVAPGSADRILRDLRQRGEVGYTVVSRSLSLYRIDWMGSDLA